MIRSNDLLGLNQAGKAYVCELKVFQFAFWHILFLFLCLFFSFLCGIFIRLLTKMNLVDCYNARTRIKESFSFLCGIFIRLLTKIISAVLAELILFLFLLTKMNLVDCYNARTRIKESFGVVFYDIILFE
jgi:hypothetical protein